MAKKNQKKKKNTGFYMWLQRIRGGILIAAALAVLVSVLSYHPDDPSFNNQNGQPAANVLGVFGSYTADMILCGFGIVLPIFVCGWLVWGYSLIKYHTVVELKIRILAFVIGTISAVLGLQLLTSYQIFNKYPLGGSLFKDAAARLNFDTGFAYQQEAVLTLLFVVAAMSLNLVLGITLADWWKWLRFVGRGIGCCLDFIYRIIAKILRLLTGKRQRRDERPAIEPQLKSKPDKKVKIEPAVKSENAVAAPKKARPLKSQSDDGYVYPDINLLSRPKDKGGNEISQKELDAIARQLENVLQEFGVNGRIVRVRPGPVVTLYELEPAPGTKTARVIGLADDIARSMSAVSVRIAVVPGSNTIGIEMPNARRETVWLKDLLSDPMFKETKNTLNIVLGKDIGGKNTYADLAKMPHLLVAGTTGSGKSVGVNSMILSLLYRLRPDECKLIMIDPKMLEFSMYNGIPHLLTPVITDPAKAVVGLKWAVREMEERYRKMAQLNVRNIAGYNQKLREMKESGEDLTRTIQVGFDPETGKPVYEQQQIDTTPLPYIVIVVDEMADLMLVAGKEVEAAIQRLAQMARAAGLHLIMSTQRPSVDVITGTIKANFPSRISFQVTSKIDSRTILGEQGAEQLLGMGDMLYMPAGLRPLRVHGSFVKDSEVEAVVEFLKSQGTPDYISEVTEGELNGKDSGAVFDSTSMGGEEDLYAQAVAIIRNDKKASTSYIQRKLRIGYNRAAALIDRMEEEGIVSAADHVGRREVIG